MIPEANTLDVFLSDRCNLACANCCAAVNKGPAHRLGWERLRASLDLFLDRVLSPSPKTVLFAGGEPLLDAALVIRAVDHLAARRRGGAPPFTTLVYTNGTRLTYDVFSRLRAAGAEVVVSLDGGPRTNDRYRRFGAQAKGSVYEAVWTRLRELPREGLALNVVLRPDGLEHLMAELRQFREAGIRSIDLWVDYFAVWDDRGLAELARFFAGLKEYYVSETEGGRPPFEIPMLRHVTHNARERAAGRPWWDPCSKLVLGADGSFYACEGCFAVPYGEAAAYRIGDAERGVDWEAREAYMRRSAAALEALGARARWQHVCPRVYYRVADQLGLDLAPLIANLHRVSEVYCGGLMTIVGALRANEAFRRAYL